MPVLSRQALYEMVWAAPVRAVAQSFGISDVGLKKVCQKAQIPVPERGYWARVRAGQPVEPTPLPPRGPGMPDKVGIGQATRFRYGSGDLEAELAEPAPDEPMFEEPIEDVQARVAALVGNVRVDRDLGSPHPVVGRLLADDETRRLKTPGAPWRLHSEPLFASAFERRRLRVLNTVFKAVDKFGGRPWVSDDEARLVGVGIGHERVAFRLDHPEARPDRAGRWTTRPGWADVLQLTLEGEGGRSWSDTEDHALETHLTEIVVHLIVAGELHHRAGALATYDQSLQRRRYLAEELVRRRAAAARQAREKRIAAEQERRRELLGMAADFRSAQDIRALVAHVSERRGPEDWGPRWTAWALAVADRLDPSTRLTADGDDHWLVAEPDWPIV